MIQYLIQTRMECLNEIRPGKICGTHIPAGKTWCPVCGERTTTRRVDSKYELTTAFMTNRQLRVQ